MTPGKFVVFEGLNGCGKGTQLLKLHNYISTSGKAVPIFTTGEPNEFDDNGKKARDILKSDGDPYINGLLAVKYFAKNRITHNKIFKSLLKKGIDVLCDRYYYSNLAYQHAQGIPYKKIIEANKGIIKPSLTLILNTTPEESAKRLKFRDGEKGRKFDLNLEFNKKVWNNYMEFGEILPELMGDNSIVYVNGMHSIENIWKDIKEII